MVRVVVAVKPFRVPALEKSRDAQPFSIGPCSAECIERGCLSYCVTFFLVEFH